MIYRLIFESIRIGTLSIPANKLPKLDQLPNGLIEKTRTRAKNKTYNTDPATTITSII